MTHTCIITKGTRDLWKGTVLDPNGNVIGHVKARVEGCGRLIRRGTGNPEGAFLHGGRGA